MPSHARRLGLYLLNYFEQIPTRPSGGFLGEWLACIGLGQVAYFELEWVAVLL
jgi:hypothetical protein